MPTPELIYRDTRKVCREGTVHPLTHYGTCLATHPWCPLCNVLELFLNFLRSELSSDKALMTPFMYVVPELRTIRFATIRAMPYDDDDYRYEDRI